jgi:hypothetical protein
MDKVLNLVSLGKVKHGSPGFQGNTAPKAFGKCILRIKMMLGKREPVSTGNAKNIVSGRKIRLTGKT